MTQRAEAENKLCKTIIHKITPEEEELYSRPKYQYMGFLDKVKSLKEGVCNE